MLMKLTPGPIMLHTSEVAKSDSQNNTIIFGFYVKISETLDSIMDVQLVTLHTLPEGQNISKI